jgi:two-component system, OmpR family, sensor kinase
MNQRLRVTFFSVLITTLVSLGIGGFALQDSHDAALRQVDSRLNFVIQAAMQNQQDFLNAALFALDAGRIDASIVLITPRGEQIPLTEASQGIALDTSLPRVTSSVQQAVSVNTDNPYRMRSIPLPEEEFLVVAISIDDLERDWRQNIARLLVFLLFANSLAIALSFLLLRNNSRKLEQQSLLRMQRFLSDAAHELRTPLTVIKGYSELLGAQKIEAKQDQEKAFARVDHEVKRMESLINDLLLTAELNEATHLDFELYDISSALKTHLRDFEILSPERKIESEIKPGLHIKASGDHLDRMIQNIFSNIRRHTPASAPVLVQLRGKGKEVHLRIEDGGPGLPEDAYSKASYEFERFDRSRSRDTGGSGLGLSIIAAIVKEHSGSISLSKSALGGLAIHIHLPIK